MTTTTNLLFCDLCHTHRKSWAW